MAISPWAGAQEILHADPEGLRGHTCDTVRSRPKRGSAWWVALASCDVDAGLLSVLRVSPGHGVMSAVLASGRSAC